MATRPFINIDPSAELASARPAPALAWLRRHKDGLLILAIAGVVFLGGVASPPSLMDDVDAAHAQLARNMIQSGDWVIPRLDGVAYIEKPPLPYWMIAVSYSIFGVHDWAARIPFALAAILLCWVTALYGRWAFGGDAGFYAGLALATCAGLFLFTRILIPDAMVALTVCLCFWAFQRALNEDGDEAHPRLWAGLMAAALGVGVMLKGLIAAVVLVGGALLYLACRRRLFLRDTWRRLHPAAGACIFLGIAAPWHVLATRRLPPYFDFTLHSGPGQYHGFLWFYFMNEHVLRFLGLRYPHDYNTVPRLAFWLLNLLWLFPWSFYLPSAARLSYKPVSRAGRTRLLALCWIGFLLLFFSFSTTQEYYSLPIYPALALLLGSALSLGAGGAERWTKVSTKALGAATGVAAMVAAALLYAIRGVPAPADIARALEPHLQAYTLSLGHMGDLTLRSFAYLRAPLALAAVALAIGAAGALLLSRRRALLALAAMMVLFFQAARMALMVFDPYLSSRPLGLALARSPRAPLIVDGAYYDFSSVFFYANRTALLLNGRVNNLEYGSYAPGAPAVFIDDRAFERLWRGPSPYLLVTDSARLARLQQLVGAAGLRPMAASGGKLLLANRAFGIQGEGAGTQPAGSVGETVSAGALW